jgi:hypothetical protein
MATVPSGTRFIGIATSVDLTERKSAVLNKTTEPFTIEDIASTVGVGATGPQGVQGPAGPLGPVGPAGLEWQGAWVSGTSYVADDAVGYDGASWFCILATSGTTNPSADATHWALLASQGAQGIQGVQGPTGPQGAGATQTLQQTVALGNTVTGGSSIVIQNDSNVSDLSGGDLSVYNSLDITDVYPGNITFTKQTGSGVIELKVPSTVLAPRVITLPDASGTVALKPTESSEVVANSTPTNFSNIDFVRIFASGTGKRVKLNQILAVGDQFTIKNESAYSVILTALSNNINGNSNLTIKSGEHYQIIKDDSGTNSLSAYRLIPSTVNITPNLQQTVALGNTVESGTITTTLEGSYLSILDTNFLGTEIYKDSIRLRKLNLSGDIKNIELVSPTNISDNRTITLPDASGTLALTSDIASALKMFVTQSGSDAPLIDTTSKNTTGKTFTITRQSAGNFRITPNTPFSNFKKVFVTVQNQGGYYVLNTIGISNSFISWSTYDPQTSTTSDLADYSSISIEIYA